MKYVTLLPDDKRLKLYLDGYREDNIPVTRVLDANETQAERHYTFQVLNQRPAWQWKEIFFKSHAPTLILIVLLPLLYVALAAKDLLSISTIGWLIFGVINLLLSASTWSEVRDYRTGWDLANPIVANRSWLYQGIISSRHLLYLSYLFFVMAILAALQLGQSLPNYVWFWPLLGWGLVIMWVWYPFQLKYRKGGEFILFILFGPLLTCGIAVFLQQSMSLQLSVEGCIWGVLATLYLQQKRFLNLMGDTRSGKRTTLVHLGFDHGKKYFIYLSGFLVLLASGYLAWFYSWWVSLIYLLWMGFHQFQSVRLLRESHSPLGKSFFQINLSLSQMVKSQLVFWVGLAVFRFWIWN